MGDTGAVSDAVFMFRAGTTLSMAAGKKVILKGGASRNNIYWTASVSAIFAVDCVMEGSIFAGTITYAARSTQHGRYLSTNTFSFCRSALLFLPLVLNNSKFHTVRQSDWPVSVVCDCVH